jgi:hypothetical protein
MCLVMGGTPTSGAELCCVFYTFAQSIDCLTALIIVNVVDDREAQLLHITQPCCVFILDWLCHIETLCNILYMHSINSPFSYLESDRPELRFLLRGILAKPPLKTLDPMSRLVLSVIGMTDAYGVLTGPSNSTTLPTFLPDPSTSSSPGFTESPPAVLSLTINLPLLARCMISPTSSTLVRGIRCDYFRNLLAHIIFVF